MEKNVIRNNYFLAFFLIVLSFGFCYSQKMNNYDKRLWKKNIILLEGLGASQAVGVHYERIFQDGRITSIRAHVGLTSFYINEKYQLFADKCISPNFGGGVYFFPNVFKIGIGCSLLNDIFYSRIPETDTLQYAGTNEMYPQKNYRMRIMPYILVELEITNRWIIRGGYAAIIDPANDLQTKTFFNHWATFAVGYKFGK